MFVKYGNLVYQKNITILFENEDYILVPSKTTTGENEVKPVSYTHLDVYKRQETWLPPDNELIKERLAGTTGVWPVPEYTFVSRSVGRYHRGVDIAAKKGADIVAPFSGCLLYTSRCV